MSRELWSTYYKQPRLDLKCGKGSISAGEKCTKGRTSQGGNPISIRRHALKGAAIGAGIGGIAGGLHGLAVGGTLSRSFGVNPVVGTIAGGLGGAVGGVLEGGLAGGVIGTGVGAVRKIGAHQKRLRAIEAPIVAKHKKRYGQLKARGASSQEIDDLNKQTASELASAYDKGNLNAWSRRDSPWAVGFTPV